MSTAREVYEVLTYRGWQELFPLLSTVHEICIGQLPPTSIVEYSEHTPNLSLIGGPTPFYQAWYYSLDYCYNSQYQALDRSAWRLAINVPEPWPLYLLGFISSLPQLAWDKRLCCCCLFVCLFGLSEFPLAFENCYSGKGRGGTNWGETYSTSVEMVWTCPTEASGGVGA